MDVLNLCAQMARLSQTLDDHVLEELPFAKIDLKDQVALTITGLLTEETNQEADLLVALQAVGLQEAGLLVAELQETGLLAALQEEIRLVPLLEQQDQVSSKEHLKQVFSKYIFFCVLIRKFPLSNLIVFHRL